MLSWANFQPARLAIEEAAMEADLRWSGQSSASTARQDTISVEIGSGYGHLGKCHEHDIAPLIAKALQA